MVTPEGPIVGIDLGTTNSVVAAVIDGQPRVLEEGGEKLLPSVVGLDGEGQLIVGVQARNQLAAFPDRTVASIKRRMGTMEPVKLGDQSFTPPEISAMILRRLKDRASKALGQEVTRAVITVPAFFDENQRQATLEAGELAGLKVERIINEPTAASLVYHVGSRDRKHVLVYDFGGGTFDVSLVRMEEGVVEVLSSKGDTHLGGDDLDQALLDEIAADFDQEHGVDLRENATTRYRLLRACEQAKMALSTREQTQLTEEFIAESEGQPLNLVHTLHREDFEGIVSPWIERTLTSVDEAIRDAGLTLNQIDDLVLVGGSTRIPMVERLLREEFLREPSRSVDPDLAVALGAAVQAAMIQGETVGPVLVDVTGHTLGIETARERGFFDLEQVFTPIIHRNTPLPVRFEEPFWPLHEEQRQVEIHVLQGEFQEVHRNRSIGKFKLELDPTQGKDGRINVAFDLSLNGTLTVTATQVSSGKRKELTIRNALSQFQEHQRVEAAQRLNSMFEGATEGFSGGANAVPKPHTKMADASSESPAESAASAKYSAALALLEQAARLPKSVSAEDAQEIEQLRADLAEAVEADDELKVARLVAELDDILFYVQ